MRLKLLKWELDLSVTSTIGIALVVTGIALLALAYGAQSEIEDIGSTNDPVLQDRLLVLENQRDAFVIISIGVLFLGFFALFVLKEQSMPKTVSESQMIAAARTMGEVISGLSLAGNASYLPPRHGLTQERIFIPAPRIRSVPPVALSDDLIMSPGKDGSTPGMLVDPPGRHLIEEIERELNASLENIGLEALEGMMQMLKHGFNLISDFHFREQEDKVILRVEYGELLDACRTIRGERPDTCRQLACIGCSALLTAATRATGKIVAIDDVDNATDRIVFTLSLREW